jgi:hypothetical protein
MDKIKFVEACRKFFGLKDGQSPMDFLKEIKQLTPVDRAEIAAGIGKQMGCAVEV